MKKGIVLFLIMVSILGILPVYAKDNNDEKEFVDITKNARNAILIDAFSGEILYNKDANKPVSVASLTKMMGLVLIFDDISKGGLKLDEILTVSENAKNMGGTQIWLEVGEKISVNDLIKGVVMASANDAMVLLAERMAGSEEAFVAQMNKKARELGLKNTYFKNSTGLDEEGHYSSAYDMAMIARELLNYEKVLDYSSIYEGYIRENTKNKSWLVNTNKLVRFYEGADGLKTGFTDDAKRCIAATAKRGNLRLIMVGLGYDNSNVRNTEAMNLLDYGFNQYEAKQLFKKGDIVGSKKLEKASRDKLEVMVSRDVTLLKKKIEKQQNYVYDLDINNISYPISKGDEVGILYIKVDNQIKSKVPVVATSDIDKINMFELYFKIFRDIISGNG